MSKLKQSLAKKFEIKDLGQLWYFLEIEVARTKKGIVVSQRKHILDILKETWIGGRKPSKTPVEVNAKLGKVKDGVPVDTDRYQRLVGRLIYLSHTRPYIFFRCEDGESIYAFPIWEISWSCMYRILQYLKGTPRKGLFFKKNEKRGIEVYTHADWAGSIEDQHQDNVRSYRVI